MIGAIAGYLALWIVYWGFKLATGKDGMGYGDFKLLAAIGAWLGWKMLPVVILLSSLVGAVVGISLIVFARHGRNVPIPFGPYLVLRRHDRIVLGRCNCCTTHFCKRCDSMALVIGAHGRHRQRQEQRRQYTGRARRGSHRHGRNRP